MGEGFSIDEKIVLGGGGVAAVGALLPWVGSGLFDGAGLEGGREVLVLFAAIVLFGLLYVGDWTKTTQLLTTAVGVAITGLAGFTLLEAFEVIGDASASAGIGLYLTLLAGLIVLAGGVRGYTDTQPEAGMYSHR